MNLSNIIRPLILFALYVYKCTADNLPLFIITELKVPEILAPGVKVAELVCRYDANFTSLTWLKGNSEFLKYQPRGKPQIQSFSVPGIDKIDVIECGLQTCKILLGSLTDASGGVYKCALEKEGPPYQYVTKTANMVVQGTQLIDGMVREYGEGDLLSANCRGTPGSEIRWYVNGREVKRAQGSQMFKTYCSRSMFHGDPPMVTVQCAEFNGGNLLGSREGKATWKGIIFENNRRFLNPKEDPNENQETNAATRNELNFFIFCAFFLKSYLF